MKKSILFAAVLIAADRRRQPRAPAAYADDMKKDTMSKDTMSKDSDEEGYDEEGQHVQGLDVQEGRGMSKDYDVQGQHEEVIGAGGRAVHPRARPRRILVQARQQARRAKP